MCEENKLVLRIKSSDFSEFAGFYHTNENFKEHNEVLNEYIKLYKENNNIKYFHIECDRSTPMHTIAYICHEVGEKYFIGTDFVTDNVKDYVYRLCFYKETHKQ